MILAIDPGSTESAYCIYDDGVIGPSGKISNAETMKLIKRNMPMAVAIEMIASYGMPVGAEVFETCVWVGRFIEAAGGHARLIYRKDVKLHLCQNPRANDSSIRQRLIDIFGKPGTKKAPGATYGLKADEWQALALAVTAAETSVGVNMQSEVDSLVEPSKDRKDEV